MRVSTYQMYVIAAVRANQRGGWARRGHVQRSTLMGSAHFRSVLDRLVDSGLIERRRAPDSMPSRPRTELRAAIAR